MPDKPRVHRPPALARQHKPRPDTTRNREAHRKAGMSARWKKFRAWFLAQNPLCVDCREQGRITPARHVHHRRKTADDLSGLLDPENCVALCASCHNRRTARGE